MAIRTKTKKRLLVLLTIVMIVTAGGTGAFFYRKKQRKDRALLCRELGLEELERGELGSGMRNLVRYLREFPEDAEVLYRLASARRRVGLPNGQHISVAISLLRQSVDLDPSRPEAHRELMELYAMRGFSGETLGSADSLLQLVPGDPQALRMKVEVLCRVKRLHEAFQTALELNERSPDSLDDHVLTLYVLSRQHRRQDMLDRAAKLLTENPDDVRYELLNAVALTMANRRRQAEVKLAQLSTRAFPDASFVRVLVRTNDSLGRFEDSLATLRRLTPDLLDSGLRRDLVRRLWEGGLVKDVEKELATLDPAEEKSDSELLAFLAYTRIEQERKEGAKTILDALASRKFDLTARAWEKFLRALVAEEAPGALELSLVCRDAGSLDPKNPYIDYALGDAYYRLGEYELAVEFWKKASSLAPAWAMPHVGIARARVLLGERKRGLKDIASAFRRARTDVRVAVPWAVAGGPTDKAALENLIETLPDTPENLTVRVTLLVRADRREDAVALVREVLAREPPPEESILLSLSSVCRASEIALDDECLARIERAHGLTADLAFARARRLEAKEGREAALGYLESVHPGLGKDVGLAWSLVWARYLDRARDERALGALRSLADRWPEELTAQRTVLEARASRRDRALFDRTVDRLKALTGKKALRWRVFRAQWLLDDQDADEKSFTEASRLLSDVIEIAPEFVKARYLMARALENLQDLTGAVEQLEKALEVDPDSMALGLELARLRQRGGDFKGAMESLSAIIASRDAHPYFVRAAALLLARQGDLRVAVAALEGLRARSGEQSPTDNVLLLRWYARLDELAKAEALCKRLLERRDTASLTAAALYLKSRGRPKEASDAIRVLESLDLEPPEKELALASYQRLIGNQEAALEQYRRATQAVPGSARCWIGHIVMSLLVGEVSEGREAMAAARRALPEEEVFAFLSRNERIVSVALAEPNLRTILVAAIEDARERTAFLETAALIADAKSRGVSAKKVKSDLRGLARRHVGSLPLQILVVRDLIASGEVQAAATLAQRAMLEFPQSGIAAQLAATAHAQAGRMKDAYRAALAWRHRSIADAVSADVMIAKIEVRQGDPDDAFRRLEPYLERLSTLARGDDDLIMSSVGILIASGHDPMAAGLLEPLLAESPVWRRRWIMVAAIHLRRAETSAEWLRRVEKVIPEDSVEERLDLVRGWCGAWRRHKRAEFVREARAIVERLAAGGRAPASVLLARGMIADEVGDRQVAEKSYREALALDDTLAFAHNNMAMILVGRKEYAEALGYAKSGCEHEPSVPDFHDTLAIVQSALGEHALAAKAFHKAVELDPKNPEWRLGLVRELIDSDQIAEARLATVEIDGIRPRGGQFGPGVERRLRELRDELKNLRRGPKEKE